jgi:hypothetical protein
MKFNITLRSLTDPGTPALIRMISGAGAVPLPTKFPVPKGRRVGTLVRRP